MKTLLLSTVAAGVVFAAAPALAQIDVTVGGHTKNYIGFLNQDTVAGADVKNFDMLRESEIHFNAEGTADNGLTYGFHVETEMDAGDDANTVEESYLYLASNMGRVNLGSEDGANYLLQVAAPSADSNIDGIRSYINAVNYTAGVATTAGPSANGAALTATGANDGFDYDNDETGVAEKITYLSPVWSGFQFGVSYTPDVLDANSASGLTGFNAETAGFEDAYDAAVRYEGNFNNVGMALGAGYTQVQNDSVAVTADDLKEWNVGADFDIGAFGVGAVYTTENRGLDNNGDSDTYVVGVDYTTGPFQLGASYFDNKTELSATTEANSDRWAAGVVYTAAPGLSFRGSVNKISHESTGLVDTDGTSVLGGVQLNF